MHSTHVGEPTYGWWLGCECVWLTSTNKTSSKVGLCPTMCCPSQTMGRESLALFNLQANFKLSAFPLTIPPKACLSETKLDPWQGVRETAPDASVCISGNAQIKFGEQCRMFWSSAELECRVHRKTAVLRRLWLKLCDWNSLLSPRERPFHESIQRKTS